MYKCLECGHIFEECEEATWRDDHGICGGFYETFSGCPLCRSDYKEVYSCRICGTPCDGRYCEGCKEEVQSRFIKLVETNFTKEERKLLNELYDGEEI